MKKIIVRILIGIVGLAVILMIIGAVTGGNSEEKGANETTKESVIKKSSTTKENKTSAIDNSTSTVKSSTSSSSSEIESSFVEERDENQALLDKDFQSMQDGSYPYAQSAKVKTDKNGDIDYVQLNVSGDWATMSAEEKENYIGFLKTIAANFMDKNGKMPFMQISMANNIVARSKALNTNDIKLVD